MAQDLTQRCFVTDEIAGMYFRRQNVGGSAADQRNSRQIRRPALPFRAVNVRTRPGYDPGLQRHHLLPRQLQSKACFAPLFEAIGQEWPGFNDFRTNGLLLPCNDTAALQMGLPLHRGPHHEYNAMVMERVGEVETLWSSLRRRAPQTARRDAVARMQRLQQDLRLRLLDAGRERLALNRRDPLSHLVDFTELDAMADALWSAGDPAASEPAFLCDQPETFTSAIPLDDFTRAASLAWA